MDKEQYIETIVTVFFIIGILFSVAKCSSESHASKCFEQTKDTRCWGLENDTRK